MSHEETQKSFAIPQPEPPADPAAEASARDLPKAYDPSIIERRWAEYWVRERLFEVPTPETDAPHLASEMWDSKPFTMLLPPPNVTGNLHMGHMFEHAESDILIRWHRICGDTVLWLRSEEHTSELQSLR